MLFSLLGFQIRRLQLAIASPRTLQRHAFSHGEFPCSRPPKDFQDCDAEDDDPVTCSSSSPSPPPSERKAFSNESLHCVCKEGHLDAALCALLRLQASPPMQVYMSVLKACIKQKSLTHTYHVYAHLAQHQPHPTGLLGDYLVGTLARCGAVEEARHVSHRLPRRTVFCWTAMISSYTDYGREQEALMLHRCMQKEGVEPNQHTYASLFKACGSIPAPQEGKELHHRAQKKGFLADAFVGTALVNMYSKFGDIVKAEGVFGKMVQRDIISWTAMLTAYVDHGQGEKALQLYHQMQAEGHAGEGNYSSSVDMFEKMQLVRIQPNEVTFSSLLAACSHAGLVMEGLHFFKFITQETSLSPDLKHYNSMIDLFGRAGNFKGLVNVLRMMSMQGDLTFWLCLLSVCRIHGNIELAKQAFDHAVDLQPNYPAAYILLSNIYADAGLQECAAAVKKSMQMLGLEEAWQEFE